MLVLVGVSGACVDVSVGGGALYEVKLLYHWWVPSDQSLIS